MKRKLIIALAALFIAINVGIVAVALLADTAPTPRPMPHPNGYDDFVRAGKLVVLSASDYTNFPTMGHDELAALVASNRDALAAVRVGLAHDSLVPEDSSTDSLNAREKEYASFKRLSQVFCAEGRLAELEGRTNDAAKIYLDAVRFAQDSSRGGVMISRLFGIACENIAFSRLRPLSDALDATNSRAAARELETLDARADTTQQTLQQEARWVRRTYGIRGQIEALLTRKMMQPVQDDFTAKGQRSQLQRKQVMLAFAARAYELDKGKPPATAADLVPAYLKAAPQNPATGQDLRPGP